MNMLSAISSSQLKIFPELMSGIGQLDATTVWAANRNNVPTASPAPGFQQSSPTRSDCGSEYSWIESSAYIEEFPSYLNALNDEPNLTVLQNANAQQKKGFIDQSCVVPDNEWMPDLTPDQMSIIPDTDFLMNLFEGELKDSETSGINCPTGNCAPESPGFSSGESGYNSGDEILEILSNCTGSPAPVEAVLDEAPSPKPEESQVVPSAPTSPNSTPAKPSKPHTSGRRKRGPRSLTLHNGNGPIQLWQFLLNILVNGPEGLVQWTHDEPFEFKLLSPCAVATMWGKQKNKPSMNYEKLSRGLRYYYGKHILEKVHGKRYVYQFQCDIPKILGFDPTSSDPKQVVEDAVCDSPDLFADDVSDTSEDLCSTSVSGDDSSSEIGAWDFAPGLW